MPPVIYLLDGHAIAYRAYFALTRGSQSGFTTSSGEPTAGVFGFTSILLRLLEQDHPEYLAVTFDTGKTFRDEIFPDYKGTREKMPDDLRTQIKRIRELVDAFNIPRLEIEGYEADDVLGSVARQMVAKGFAVKIITGDRDLLQLCDERILVSLPGKNIADSRDFFPKDVLEYLGVRPEQVVDYKALVGDKSDNIPGVAGIGEKTAVSLLEKYDTLDGVYEHLDELTETIRKKLVAGKEDAYMSRKLATIVIDLDIPMDIEMARTEQFEPARIEEIFRQLEFRSLLQRLTALYPMYGKAAQPTAAASASPAPASRLQQLTFLGQGEAAQDFPKPASQNDITYQVVDTPALLSRLVESLSRAEVISLDTETTSTDQMQAELVGISLAVDENQGFYIPVGHRAEMGKQLPMQTVLDALRGALNSPTIQKVGHNLKYDVIVLARYGLTVAPLSFDTMIAEWLVNPSSRNLGLKNLAWVRLNLKMTDIQSLIGSGKNQRTMAEVPIAAAAAYAAADAAVVLHLLPVLRKDLQASGSMDILNEIEMPLVPVLVEMEMSGIALDINFLGKMSAELSKRMADIEDKVYQAVGEPFNINSTQQLSQALFDRLKLMPPDRTRRTEAGYYSTSADVLEGLRGKHSVVDLVLEYRELSKLRSTYLEALPAQVNPQTGRVHTSYNQTGSVTGRLASSDPNLQNIPIRTDLGRQVRQGFVAAPGCKLLSVDYSQVELRIVAHMANDESMLEAFRAGQDIHAATAAAIFNVPLASVTKEQRRHAKAINFGLIYGMSAFGLSRNTDLTLAEAEDFVDAYFKQFPGIKRYLDGIRLKATQQGYVETLLGRKRYFPGLKTQSNQSIRNREEREAINAPIQGTAADIMKIAMLRVPTTLRQAGLQCRMLLQVHDELVLECPEAELIQAVQVVQQVMQEAYTLSVPLLTEAKSGSNWGDLKPL